MAVWVPPQYNTNNRPALQFTEKLTESSDYIQNFPRVAKWSPDGSTVLCQCENRTFELLNLPQDVLSGNMDTGCKLDHRTFLQPSAILDYVWYPGATSSNPASFCFVASVRECPVKLVDASDGRLRASYKIVDHRERQIAPHSIAFNMMADKIYCGFEDAIEIFDMNYPGEGVRLPTTPSKKSRDGLKGVVSTLAFSPSHDIFAAGSLASSMSNIALFSESGSENPIMFVSADVKAAVTQLLFNPTKPHILYASFRKQHGIYSWDIRANVSTPLQVLQRNTSARHNIFGVDQQPMTPFPQRQMTNQKLRFDVDLGGRWLAAGDQHGTINIFDLNHEETNMQDADSANAIDVMPSLIYEAHGDAIGSVAFHPLNPLLLSVSGSRQFVDEDDASSSSECEGDEDAMSPEISVQKPITRRFRQPTPLDASIKLWNFGEPEG